MLLQGAGSVAHAAFVDSPGKRLTALGGAAVADRGDPMGFFYNPASLAWGHAIAFETQFGRHFVGLQNDNLNRGALGGYYSLEEWGTVGVGYDYFGGELYNEQRFLTSFGRRFGPLAVGIGINFLFRTYEQTEYTAVDPFFDEYGFTKTTFAVDLGAQYRYTEDLSFGFAARRLNRPNQAFEEGVDDPLPREFQGGASYRLGDYTLFGDIEFRDRELNGADVTPRLGVETSLFEDLLVLQAGGNRDEIAFGVGVHVYDQVFNSSYLRPTAEGGRERVNENRTLLLKVGYTFRYPIGGVSGTAGHHLIGANIYFDRIINATDIAYTGRSPEPDAPEVVIQIDTVFVPQYHEIVVEVADSAEITMLRSRIGQLEREVEIIGNFNEAMRHLDRAQVYYFDREFEAALRECGFAIDLIPNLAYAYVRLGSIYLAMGNIPDARRAWETALRHDPAFTEVREYLRQLPR